MPDFEKLSQLQINHHKSGTPVMGFGMELALSLRDGETPAKRLAVLDVIRQIQNTFPEDATAFLKGNSNRLTQIKGNNFLDYYQGQIEKLDGSDERFGALITKQGKLPPVTINTHLGKPDRAVFSSFVAHVPLGWFKDNSKVWISLILQWCDLTKPAKGVAGIAPVAEFGTLRSLYREYWPFLARFPCLSFLLPYYIANRQEKALAPANWLTILNDSLVAELGGLDALTAALGEGITIHEWDGGILIQAGEMPELGDVNQGNWPRAYCQVNDATKALRFEDYPNTPVGLIRVPEPLDAYEETLKWVRRFDGRI